MFMGPLEATKPWNEKGVEGIHRFLSRVWRLFVNEDGSLSAKITADGGTDEFKRTWHKTLKKVTEDFEHLRFNTAISQLMIFINDAYKQESLSTESAEQFVQMLSPLAPHIAEELWQLLGHEGSISYVAWPEYDEAWTVDAEVEIVVQVNGKIVQRALIPLEMGQQEMQDHALALPNVKAAVEGKTVRKIIAVPGKLGSGSGEREERRNDKATMAMGALAAALAVNRTLDNAAAPEHLVELFHILIVFVMSSGNQAFEYTFETDTEVVQRFCGNTAPYGHAFLQLLRSEGTFCQQLACAKQHFPGQAADQLLVDAGCFYSRFDPPFQEIAEERRAAAGEVRGNPGMALRDFFRYTYERQELQQHQPVFFMKPAAEYAEGCPAFDTVGNAGDDLGYFGRLLKEDSFMSKRAIGCAFVAALLGGGLIWTADHRAEDGIAGWETLNTGMAQAVGVADSGAAGTAAGDDDSGGTGVAAASGGDSG
ncbi:hypothetical protein KC345_g11299, partial [Hortaea werneckii]